MRGAIIFAGMLVAIVVGCGGGSQAPADLIPDMAAETGSYTLLSETSLDGIMQIESYGCRDDAIFVAVDAGAASGVYKLEIGDADLGWRLIYDQEGVICPTEDSLIIGLLPGNT